MSRSACYFQNKTHKASYGPHTMNYHPRISASSPPSLTIFSMILKGLQWLKVALSIMEKYPSVVKPQTPISVHSRKPYPNDSDLLQVLSVINCGTLCPDYILFLQKQMETQNLSCVSCLSSLGFQDS